MTNNGKIAVIGTGYWGSKHVEELVKLGKEVIAVDLNQENLLKMQELFDIERNKQIEELLTKYETENKEKELILLKNNLELCVIAYVVDI